MTVSQSLYSICIVGTVIVIVVVMVVVMAGRCIPSWCNLGSEMSIQTRFNMTVLCLGDVCGTWLESRCSSGAYVLSPEDGPPPPTSQASGLGDQRASKRSGRQHVLTSLL
jgi:hypothetical protein